MAAKKCSICEIVKSTEDFPHRIKCCNQCSETILKNRSEVSTVPDDYQGIPSGSLLVYPCKNCGKPLNKVKKPSGAAPHFCNEVCSEWYVHRRGKPRKIQVSSDKAKKPPDYWYDNQQELRDLAKKYKTRTAFEKDYAGGAAAARRLGIHDDICSHMIALKQLPHGYWKTKEGKERIDRAVDDCSTIKELRERFKKEHDAAKRLYWPEVKKKLAQAGNYARRHVYTIVGTCDGKYSAYIGITCQPSERFRNHHIIEKMSEYKIAWMSPLMDASEAVDMEIELIDRLKDMNRVVCLNSQKGGGIGGNAYKWTRDRILKQSLLKNTTAKERRALRLAKERHEEYYVNYQ